jgi:hypothetical protein
MSIGPRTNKIHDDDPARVASQIITQFKRKPRIVFFDMQTRCFLTSYPDGVMVDRYLRWPARYDFVGTYNHHAKKEDILADIEKVSNI